MADPGSSLNISIMDHTGRVGKTRISSTLLSADNFDAQLALVAAMESAIGNVTLGNISGIDIVAAHTGSVAGVPNDDSLRGVKASVRYMTNVSAKAGHIEIPCADPSLDMDAHAGVYYSLQYPTGAKAVWTAFKTAFENLYVDAKTGETVTIIEIVAVTSRD